MTLYSFINNYLEPTGYFIYLIALWLYARRYSEKHITALLAYCFLTFVVMLIASIMVQNSSYPNIWLYNIHAFLTIVFLGFYFRNLFQSRFKVIAATLLCAIIVVYLLVKNIVLQDFQLFDSMGYSLVSAAVVFFVLMYFHQLLSNVTDQNILRNFNFWLASGYLIYFAGSFIIFLSYYYLTTQILATYTAQERELLTTLWGVHNMLLFVSAFSLLIGSLWLTYRKKSVSS
ncbi:MAG TPA: hypothetical protein VGN63_13305 [Flavisolibacter sp.]|nr:hypothetical protein [Flavisolibacter sp.]